MKLKNIGKVVNIYTNQENEGILYVGEGIIKDRLLRHYKKSYEERV